MATLPTGRWIEPVSRLVLQLADACHLYHRQHYSAVLGSNFFIKLDSDLGFGVSQIEDQMLLASKNLGVEQACRSYARYFVSFAFYLWYLTLLLKCLNYKSFR